jgi:hypothetical protein
MRDYLQNTPDLFRRCRALALLGAAAFFVTLGASAPIHAQITPANAAIGSLVGDDVLVSGAISFDVSGGRSTALLASGSQVTVRSGKARIDLGNDDVIAICGPARFSIIKSGDALTLALDYGEVHPQLSSAVTLTIYMPLIVATPVAIGDGARDVTIGLDQAGALCAMPVRGALRIEEQLAGQGVLVPQGGQVSFTGGQLNTVRNSAEACSCELLVVADTVKRQFTMNLAVQPPVQPAAASQPKAPTTAPATPASEPVYRITVPLVFDARAPRPPATDPPMIIIDQQARLAPKLDFLGGVEPAPPSKPAPPKPAAQSARNDGSAAKKPNVFARVFGIFHHHHNEPRCAGVGCGAASGTLLGEPQASQ